LVFVYSLELTKGLAFYLIYNQVLELNYTYF